MDIIASKILVLLTGPNIRFVLCWAQLPGRPRHGHRRPLGRPLQRRCEGPLDRGNVRKVQTRIKVSWHQTFPLNGLFSPNLYLLKIPRLEQETGGDGEGRPGARNVLGAEEQEARLGGRHFGHRRGAAGNCFSHEFQASQFYQTFWLKIELYFSE